MAEFTVRPMPGQGEATVIRHHWSDEKRCRSLSLTQDSWKILGALANDCGNRSEVIEIITRYAYNANLDLSSIRKELLPTVMTKDERSKAYHEGRPEGTYPAKKQESSDACGITPPVDACGLKPTVEIDFDAPVQCSI